MPAPLPISMTARNIGLTEILDAIRRDIVDADVPLPLWMQVHQKARETHIAIDRELMLATGDDLEDLILDRFHRKERKACSSTSL